MPVHRIKKRQLEAGIEIDMTPMIDIVFLLIAFFMIVSDLSNLNIQHVILPVASEAVAVEKKPGQQTVILNVVMDKNERDGAGIRIGGSPENLDLAELSSNIKIETEVYGKFEKNPADPSKMDSLLDVTVRCDERAPAGLIHKIYKACQTSKVFKVRIAANTERLEPEYK